MKFKCFDTAIVVTYLTTTTLEFNSHQSYFLAAALNRFN